jgi:G3E family GTPase
VVTVVDAKHISQHWDAEEAQEQIAFADIILLNKTDLATPEKVKELEDYIRTVKDGARILHSQHGEVPLPLILGLGLAEIDLYINRLNEDKHDHKHDHDHDHEHDHEHDHKQEHHHSKH